MGPTSTDPANITLAGERLLTRRQAAEKLDISVSTLRRWEGKTITPIVGEDGVHRFPESVVEEHAAAGTLARQEEAREATVASQVFTLLREGVPAEEIVIRLELEPKTVLRLRSMYARSIGGFVVTSAVVQGLEAPSVCLGHNFPINSGPALVAAIQVTLACCSRCSKCGVGIAQFCRRCVETGDPRRAWRKKPTERAPIRQSSFDRFFPGVNEDWAEGHLTSGRPPK